MNIWIDLCHTPQFNFFKPVMEALAFEGRTKGRERILELELSNEQVATRIINIYEQVMSERVKE